MNSTTTESVSSCTEMNSSWMNGFRSTTSPWQNWLHGYAKEKKMRDMKILSANEFRQRLAGVVAPTLKKEDREEAKQDAIKFGRGA